MRPAIIYFDYSYTFQNYLKDGSTVIKDKARVFKKIPSFDNETELEDWVRETENDIATEFLEKDFEHRDNVEVYITNIVRM